MDKIDQNILTILQQDASLTNAALAERVNLAPSSCLRRVQKLKQQGIIKKTVAVIDEKTLGRNLHAIVEIDLARHGHQAYSAFQERVKHEIAVTKAFSISGESDVILNISLKDMEEYQAFCDRVLNHDDNVLRFRTNFVMRVIKE
ncbi:Lrp/AsnC family transcriptional regulator [Terasakiella sp. A23]|uniref:Lrp/AsnC family transcriptional regulator n=1 Tax=Terasakiella sp. FCG-A23 TaxID=3080561 RepID=UPI0029540F6F|nr:Lrp/AsnC family transcriptional regulator [Terasakiella sp. A23]MDV7338543.1 Lrp/AsnC family transcriptional regulator [Terasakiella sp. A23]